MKMSKLITKCPSCQHDLEIAVLHCPACGLELRNDFELSAFEKLSREQNQFLMTFLKNRGNLKNLQNELQISYPLSKKKLDELLLEKEEFDSNIWECAAGEDHIANVLRAHGHKLYYYDNRKQGEVDYLVDNHTMMSAHPIEVKSGKDYTKHSALNNLLKIPDYNVLAATIISNERKVYQDGKVTYMPIYFVMFMEADTPQTDEKEYIF